MMSRRGCGRVLGGLGLSRARRYLCRMVRYFIGKYSECTHWGLNYYESSFKYPLPKACTPPQTPSKAKTKETRKVI